MGFRHLLIFLTRKILRPQFLFLLLLLLAFSFYRSLKFLPDGRLHLRFLDVGQGDSIFVTTAKGSKVLIDGGPDGKAAGLIGGFLPLNDRTIDLILLTHAHADHAAGLIAVLREFKVKNIVFNRLDYATRTYADFLAAVEAEQKQGAKVFAAKSGDQINLGELNLKILWPQAVSESSPSALSQSAEFSPSGHDLNNQSIVVLLSYGDFDAFLPGDEEADEAKRMAAKVFLPQVEVLKVGHHGSSNGLYDGLLKALKPQLAVISLGRNNAYGFPSERTLNLLSQNGVRVLRTDFNGTIEIVSDGKTWGIR